VTLFVFGLGYAARAIVAAAGGVAVGTTRDGRGDSLRYDDAEAVRAGLAASARVLVSIPPDADGDPVLRDYVGRFGADLLAGKWVGYLSSTGVYGDVGGAWVDERAPADRGRRAKRNAADAAWLARGAHVFRLPGIYGPGRSALERVARGEAHRTGIEGQVFSRVHVDDIAGGVVAAFDAPAGAYNLSDDEPASQDAVVDYAARLLDVVPPPFVSLDQLSPMARGFYAENRRVANNKAKRVLGWRPRFPDYRFGLRAVSAMTSPAPASTPPAAASSDQR